MSDLTNFPIIHFHSHRLWLERSALFKCRITLDTVKPFFSQWGYAILKMYYTILYYLSLGSVATHKDDWSIFKIRSLSLHLKQFNKFVKTVYMYNTNTRRWIPKNFLFWVRYGIKFWTINTTTGWCCSVLFCHSMVWHPALLIPTTKS